MTFLGVFLLAAVISGAITKILLSTKLGGKLLDLPNERSLHETPRPRIGGIGICAAVFVAVAVLPAIEIEFPKLFIYVGAGALIVMLISFVDDIVSVSVGIRFLFHFAAAAALTGGGLIVRDVLLGGISIQLPLIFAVTFSILYVMWLTNLYNFMDGMDGFAGGMALVGFATLALMTASSGAFDVAGVAACLSGAAAGFLIFNFPPARVFMGDAGASTLGFFAAALTIWADAVDAVPLWISVLVFSPFIVDASVTLVHRAWNRERS